MEGNEDTDDESSISNDDGSLASESKDVQNDVVVKLEEVADWEQNHHHTAESHSTDGPSASNLEDVQNVAAVKLEEVDWEEDYLQQTAESPSTNGPQVSDLMEDVQNDVVVKLEEVTDWKENPPFKSPTSDDPSVSN